MRTLLTLLLTLLIVLILIKVLVKVAFYGVVVIGIIVVLMFVLNKS